MGGDLANSSDTPIQGKVLVELKDEPQVSAKVRSKLTDAQNIALLASAALVLASVLRVYCFSFFNPSIAMAILSVVNRTNVMASTLLNALLALAPLLLIMAVLRQNALGMILPGTRLRVPPNMVLVPFALFALFGLPLYIHAVYLAVTAVLVISKIFKRGTGKRRRGKTRPQPSAGPPFSQTLLENWSCYLVIITLIAPWCAAESISTKQGPDPVYGYVIGEQAEKVLVITLERKAVWLDQDDITLRNVCGYGGASPWLGRSIAELSLGDRGVSCKPKTP